MTWVEGQFNWSTPTSPTTRAAENHPRSPQEVLQSRSRLRMELRGLADKIPAKCAKDRRRQLKDAQQKLEEVQAEIPTETLDKIQQELKELRTQLEKCCRAERAQKPKPPRADEKQDDTEADK